MLFAKFRIFIATIKIGPKIANFYRGDKNLILQKSNFYRGDKNLTFQKSNFYRGDKNWNFQMSDFYRGDKNLNSQMSDFYRGDKKLKSQMADLYRNPKKTIHIYLCFCCVVMMIYRVGLCLNMFPISSWSSMDWTCMSLEFAKVSKGSPDHHHVLPAREVKGGCEPCFMGGGLCIMNHNYDGKGILTTLYSHSGKPLTPRRRLAYATG